MDQWNIENLKDRARRLTEEAKSISTDLQYALKLKDKRKEDDVTKKICIACAIISGIILFCGLAYCVYRFLAPDYLEDYDDYEDEEDEDITDED